jgi:hypothetical protein
MRSRRMPFSCYGSKFEFNSANRIALKTPMPRATGAAVVLDLPFLETTEILIH